jgi:formamidase
MVSHLHIRMDQRLPLAQQAEKGHNRWHPDIAPAIRIIAGSRIEIETLDGLDGQISPETTRDELARIDMGRIHPLTGPVYVEDAEPGDLLAVIIEEIRPADSGYTIINPGFGFLRDVFAGPYIMHWEISGGFARTKELPNVRIPAAPFMGVMGVAPSHELLDRIVAREADVSRHGGLILPPDPVGAIPTDITIARRGLRTIAPQEFGGNMDVKQMVAGTTLYLPVQAPGGLFSVGDAHFAQGDGETCGTAIETSATFVARFELLRGEATRRGQMDPSFARDNDFADHETSLPRRFYATTGIPIHRDGRNEHENITVAARNALLNMIDHIVDAYGYSPEQAYCLTSVAVDLRISQTVDVPNVIVSAFLPLNIFERRV